ncbi:hypothetical protein ACFV1L_22115 [Kitasatospora sp. NPDC059646]
MARYNDYYREEVTTDEVHQAIEDNDAADLDDYWNAKDNGEF